MIESGVDREGHSLRLLVWQGLKGFSTDALFQFLGDRDVIVRSITAKELQVRGGRKVFDHASHLLTRKRMYQRELGSFLLGQLGTPKRPFKQQSIKLLLNSLKSETNAIVRTMIITSLAQLKAADAINTVVSYVNDRSPGVRGSVAFAIGMIYCDRPKKIPLRLDKVLRRLQADKSRTVREFASLGRRLLEGKNRSDAPR